MKRALSASAAILLLASAAYSADYTVTVTNNLEEELLAPILITSAGNDSEIFAGDYVTPEAEFQILTGDPGMLAERIGSDAMVGHGSDGPPGSVAGIRKVRDIRDQHGRHRRSHTGDDRTDLGA